MYPATWILDLCSGLGGASEAFVNNPPWAVVRVENNPILSGVPHTRLLDVLEWIDWLPGLISEMGRPTVVWASPPCLDFTTAYSAPGPRARREGLDFEPDMSIVEACIDIIEYCRPTFHVIENVSGACPWFLPELGKHSQKIGPFFLWGVFPILLMPEGFTHSKFHNDTWSTDELRSNKRALVPIEVSEALLDAIAQQSTLADWA